jgi:hypothetical protein
MTIGTVFLFVAAQAGQAAVARLSEGSQFKQVLEHHENLAETTEGLFSVLTVLFSALLFVPKILGRHLTHSVSVALLAAFLIFYGTGALFLAKTAHQGGRLIHELGVSAKHDAFDNVSAGVRMDTPNQDSASDDQ